MISHTTDAEIAATLRAVAEHGSNESAAAALGIGESSVRRHLKQAELRGITGGSGLSKEDKLEIALKQAQRDLRAAQSQADLTDRIMAELRELMARDVTPPAWLTKATPKDVHASVPMTIWSDWHYQEVVRPEEVGGLNEFNSEIAAARIRRLVDTTIDLARNHMGGAGSKYAGIVVCLGGDMITGDIHEELVMTSDRTTQQAINELTDLIASALERVANEFGRVFVPCVVGNHGRSTRKPRMKGRVYTSHEYVIYKNLERYFRKDDRIKFLIPGESDAHFKVFGWRFLLTHGDSLGVKGGDGIIGAIGPIMRGSLKVGRSEAAVGRDADWIIMGHWHQMLWLPGVIVNGALKGYDEYARLAIRAPYSRPSQGLWFLHPSWGITARWEIFLEGEKRQSEDKWIEWRENAA
jgi:predicted phosphodiesterase